MQTFFWTLLGLGIVPQVLAGDTLNTDGFQLCMSNSAIAVDNLDVTYTRSTGDVVFNVAGTNTKEQYISASLTVTAYGKNVYTHTFDPCGDKFHVDKLCPVPSGNFSAQGSTTLPAEYQSQIPSIAFNMPDLDGQATLVLQPKDGGDDLACVRSDLSNGRSVNVKGVAWVSASMAAGALAMSGVSAMGGAAAHPGASSSSPGFGDVMGWFHTMATTGMISGSYPPVYQSFTKNFAWSTGLISWTGMQQSIDNFRKATGGNLTDESYAYLIGSGSSSKAPPSKRSMDLVMRSMDLVSRSDSSNDSSSDTLDQVKQISQQLMIPSANVFMTVLLIFAIVIGVIIVGILLFKVILETWALYGNFPKKLTDFRKDYWGLMARTITNLILVMYSIWVMYCVYQLKNGDSWAAKILAAATLTIFTAVLAFFAWRIIYMARKYKKAEGDATGLYDNEETWRKYRLFYDNTKKDFWWLFMPVCVYALVKGCIIAGAQGHGMFQSAGQLVCECMLLMLLVWNRPYARKSTLGINLTIQIVRVLSVACVLVFVDELGMSQTTKTVTGLVLIVVQSVLTGVLAILIAVNAIISLFRENVHEKRRKEAEKANRDYDDLTPFDARDSLLIDHRPKQDVTEMSKFNFTRPYASYRDHPSRPDSAGSKERLVYADYGVAHGRSPSPDSCHSGRRSPSPEGKHPTTAGYGMAY